MKLETIEQSHYYHIYNRGINGTEIFKNDENKCYFLQLFGKYISKNAEVFGYCLMDNHFHFLLRIESTEEEFTKAMSDFFNAYAKAFNKFAGRTGSLFEKHFKRKKILDEDYLKNLLIYIHKNPEEIGDYTTYKFSSLHHYLNHSQPQYFKLSKDYIVDRLFDSVENMRFIHKNETGLYKEDSAEKDLQGGLRQHLAGSGLEQNTAGEEKPKSDLQGLQKPIKQNQFELIEEFLKNPVFKIEYVSFFLINIRVLIESKKLKQKYPHINLYCNWLLHSELDREIVPTLVEDISKSFQNFSTENELNIRITEILSIKEFVIQLKDLLWKAIINEEIDYQYNIDDDDFWFSFVSILLTYITDRPLLLKNQKVFKLVENLDVTIYGIQLKSYQNKIMVEILSKELQDNDKYLYIELGLRKS